MKIIIELDSIEELNKLKAYINNIKINDNENKHDGKIIIDILSERIDSYKNSRDSGKIGLCVRTINCLLAEEIYTFSDLIKRSEIDLYLIPNLGRKSLREITDLLNYLGLSLSKERFKDANNSPEACSYGTAAAGD